MVPDNNNQNIRESRTRYEYQYHALGVARRLYISNLNRELEKINTIYDENGNVIELDENQIHESKLEEEPLR